VTLLTREETPSRTRTARLDRDEEVWIVGALAEGYDPEATSDAAAAYRENARPVGRVLRAAPTLLVSTVSLVDHFTSRAWLHRRQGLFALLLLVLPLIIVHRFADRITGHAAVGVVQKVLDVRSGKTNQITGYVAVVDVDGLRWDSEVLASKPVLGAPYELRLGKSSSNDGRTFHATAGELFASVFFLVLTVLAAAGARFRALRSLP
jgi:hypothetical protein